MLAQAVLIADYRGIVDASDRTGADVRTITSTSSPSGNSSQWGTTVGVDVYTQPRVQVQVTDRRWDCDLSYSPTLSFADDDSQGGQSWEALNAGRAQIAWHNRVVRIQLSEDASYGSFNSSVNGGTAQPGVVVGSTAPTGAPASTLQTTLFPATLTVASTGTGLGMSARTDRQTTFSVSAAYFASGGVGAESRAIDPDQYGPRFDASVDHALSRRVRLVTAAYAQAISFGLAPCALPGAATTATTECAPQDQIAQLAEGVRYAVRRAATLSMDAGVSVQNFRATRDVPYTNRVYPTGRIDWSQREGERGSITLQLGASLQPLVDIRTGELTNLASVQGSLIDLASTTIIVRASAGAGQSFPTDDPVAVTIAHADAEIDFVLSRYAQLALGERTFWQRQQAVPDFFYTVGYFAVTVRAPSLRF